MVVPWECAKSTIRLRGAIWESVQSPYMMVAKSVPAHVIGSIVLKDSGRTASCGEIRPSGTTAVASMQIAPTPRVAKPYICMKTGW